MTPKNLSNTAGIFQALAHDLRLQICTLLMAGPVSVNEICTHLNVPQHRVSQQLSILRATGIVASCKKSRKVFYSITNHVVVSILNVISALDQSDQEAHMSSAKNDAKAGMASGPETGKAQSESHDRARSGQSNEAGQFSAIR